MTGPPVSPIQRLVRRWRRHLAHVAVEEMLHLAQVSNMLAAVGGAPNFRRTNFPMPPSAYPFGVALTLEPFSMLIIERSVTYELPEPGLLSAQDQEACDAIRARVLGAQGRAAPTAAAPVGAGGSGAPARRGRSARCPAPRPARTRPGLGATSSAGTAPTGSPGGSPSPAKPAAPSPGTRLGRPGPLGLDAGRTAGPGEPVGFAAHIRPVFRPMDRQGMVWAFDLWSYPDIAREAQSILDALCLCDDALRRRLVRGADRPFPTLGRRRYPAIGPVASSRRARTGLHLSKVNCHEREPTGRSSRPQRIT
jgi:hypothetical protein